MSLIGTKSLMKTAPAKSRKHKYQPQREHSLKKTPRQMCTEGPFPISNYLQGYNFMYNTTK